MGLNAKRRNGRIEIFGTSIKTDEKKQRYFGILFSFIIGRSMFDVGRSSLFTP